MICGQIRLDRSHSTAALDVVFCNISVRVLQHQENLCYTTVCVRLVKHDLVKNHTTERKIVSNVPVNDQRGDVIPAWFKRDSQVVTIVSSLPNTSIEQQCVLPQPYLCELIKER